MSQPTQQTFEQSDKFELKSFSERLEKFLTVEHEFVEGSLVVSLNAPFGSGKSTFLSMWKADLDRQQAPDRPKAIMLNAWESDYCGDPLLSVVTGLIASVSIRDETVGEKLREAAKDLTWFTLGLANKVVSSLTKVVLVGCMTKVCHQLEKRIGHLSTGDERVGSKLPRNAVAESNSWVSNRTICRMLSGSLHLGEWNAKAVNLLLGYANASSEFWAE